MLHGVPGSGKTSVIHGLAGALNLDIYVISLAKRGLDDTVLNELICDLPARCIALMEDIDAAFTHSVSRDPKSDKTTTVDSGGESSGHAGVTLSGLLGAIDGVAAQEGRLLFATTNKYKVLDPALCRPGRMDIHVEFGLASQYQAEQLFVRFYPATDDESAEKKRAAEAALVELPLNDNEKTPLLANGSSAVAKPLYVKKIATKITSAARLAYAQEFASKIPQHELSMSAIQGHLLNYKTRPVEAVATTEAFVEAERERARKRTGVEQEKPEPSEASAAVVEVPEEKGKVEEEKPKAADVEPANGVAS